MRRYLAILTVTLALVFAQHEKAEGQRDLQLPESFKLYSNFDISHLIRLSLPLPCLDPFFMFYPTLAVVQYTSGPHCVVVLSCLSPRWY